MTHYDFDTVFERRGTESKKWNQYAPDVLPMWVADMDFAAAPEIVAALGARLTHPLLGYAVAREPLQRQIVGDMARKYDWHILPEDIVFLPGVEPGFNMALKALLAPGAKLALQTPNYHPVLAAPTTWGLKPLEFRVDLDKDAGLEILSEADALLFCNPHNPTGKVYSREELLRIAKATGGRPIISDEIHCDLLFDGRVHMPIASLDQTIAARTVTLMSAAKTYNIAGLKTAFAIVQNRDLRDRFNASRLGLVDSVNLFGLEATLAAFRDADEWKRALLAYLEANRDFLAEAIAHRFPGMTMQKPQATFLAWLDCSGLGIDNPQRFFLDEARVATSAGAEFGTVYEQFVRLNFGCPRSMLEDGLERMEAALARQSALLKCPEPKVRSRIGKDGEGSLAEP